MNHIVLIGRVTSDIELKQTTANTLVSSFSIAVKRTFKNANGEYESDFFNCVAFAKLAETVSKYVKKGDQVGVEGRLQTRNYTNKEGRKVYVTEIIVENVEFLQSKKEYNTTEARTEETDPFAYSGANFEEIDPEDGLPF